MILSAPRLLVFLATATLAAAGQAQSSFQGLYEGVQNGNFTSSDFNSGDTYATNPFTVSRSFTGVNRAGATQTMTVTGSAYSNSNVDAINRHAIHISGQGTVTNAYYSQNNRPSIDANGNFDPTGSPYQLAVHGNAGWSDNVTFTGRNGEGYTVDFLFRLEGTITGDTEAGLNFYTNRANDPGYSPRYTRVGTGTENVATMWATPAYTIQWGQTLGINADMYAGLTTNLIDHPDGSTIVGNANYGNTLTVVGIEVRDPSGNLITTGFNVTSSSGATFQPVPEPAPFLVLGLGVLGFLRRRKQA